MTYEHNGKVLYTSTEKLTFQLLITAFYQQGAKAVDVKQ
jgi:hypothetical protein